jgi:hypothetical protein
LGKSLGAGIGNLIGTGLGDISNSYNATQTQTPPQDYNSNTSGSGQSSIVQPNTPAVSPADTAAWNAALMQEENRYSQGDPRGLTLDNSINFLPADEQAYIHSAYAAWEAGQGNLPPVQSHGVNNPVTKINPWSHKANNILGSLQHGIRQAGITPTEEAAVLAALGLGGFVKFGGIHKLAALSQFGYARTSAKDLQKLSSNNYIGSADGSILAMAGRRKAYKSSRTSSKRYYDIVNHRRVYEAKP